MQPRGAKNTTVRIERTKTGNAVLGRDSDSSFAKASNSIELGKMLSERYGTFLGDTRGLKFERVRDVACGLDDALTHFGISKGALSDIKKSRLNNATYAETSSSGRVVLNTYHFADPDKMTHELAVSIGRHEGGHLIEVLMANGDDSRFRDARDAKRVINGAMRAFKKDHPERVYTALQEIDRISSYPGIEAYNVSAGTSDKKRARILAKNTYYSEGFAECVDAIIAHGARDGTFLAYVEQRLKKELGND